MAKENEPTATAEEPAVDVKRLEKRLDMLDQRLDNIDSIVTVVAERVMNQPVTLNVVCPHCGRDVEIAIIGNQKPKR